MTNDNDNIVRTKRSFNMKQEAFSIIFKGVSAARDYLRPKSGPLRIDNRKPPTEVFFNNPYKDYFLFIYFYLKAEKYLLSIFSLQNVFEPV